jgi:ribonuclease HI
VPGGCCKPPPPPPPPRDADSFKINVDGAFAQESGKAAVGVVIRDASGHPLFSAGRRVLHCRDAEEAEAWACLEGIRLARRWPDKHFTLETDCASVVGKLQAANEDKSLIAPIIRDTLREARLLRGVSLRKIWREQNKVAHSLPQLAMRSGGYQVSFSNPPECVMNLICKELP